MKTVDRTELLSILESVSHGLSPRDVIEQSSCFVFDDGEVMTYNDEIACRARINLKLTGAVQAAPLKKLLEKLPEDTLKLVSNEGELRVIGKRKQASIRMENEVLLPIKNAERPKKFRKLHSNFADAVSMAAECVSSDENKFWTTCVHVHPKWIEACDGYQIIRYRLKTGISDSTLVRGKAIKCITTLDMNEFAETDNWIHFRNKHGLMISCRRWLEPYKSASITKLLKIEGTKTILPKGLAEATERADVFSSEMVDNNVVDITLSRGKLRIKGEGVSGWYSETRKLKYKGPSMDFRIAPKLLIELTRRHNECEVSDLHIKVNGGRFIYVAVLNLAGEGNEDQESEDQGPEETGEEG